MDTERTVVPAIRDALVAACPVVRAASPEADAIAGVVPSFVAFPASTEEASALLRAAAAFDLAVVPRGAGTGLGWGPPPSACDLVIDLQAMDQVIEHAAGDLVARVQAGVTIGHLASVLGSAGQELALDVPADATVGGVVATGTAGPRRFRYGAPRDLLIGITMVRADGVVAHSGGKVVKNVAGYDLGKLFAGSQGTLGLITEVTFRLHPRPAAVAWVTADYGSAALADAASAVAAAAGSALVPSAVELAWSAGFLRMGVLLEGTSSGVTERAGRMSELIASAGGTPVVARSEAPLRWRDMVPAAGAPAVVVRVSFWLSRLAGVLEALAAAGASAGVEPVVSGPAGAGVLYACLDPGVPEEDAARFVLVLRDALAVPAGSGPRGSVVVLAAPPAVMTAAGAFGPVPGAALMRAIKDQFDPGHRMFPGRLGGQLMDETERLRGVIKDCVHCGFCLPACPTYQLWAEEMDSPRGRIYLVNQILEGAEMTPAAAEHFDRCLGCMACMTACPSGVQYDQLIEVARAWTEEARSEPAPVPGDGAGLSGGRVARLRDRAARAAIFSLFPYPRRLRAVTAPLRAAQRTGLDRRVARSSLPGRLSPTLGAAVKLAPPTSAAVRLPERVAARGPRRAVVGMLTGCVQSVFFPQVNAATARVLATEGCDVIIPRGQGCCGALSLHSGREAEAVAFARQTIETFERAGVDAIVVNSAGCGSAMKEYERLLGRDGQDLGWAGRAAALSARVRDLSEFLVELGPVAPRHPLPVTAAYHDACHLAHAQRITRQPRELLRAIPELRLVELADAGTCCGSAGVYNLLQPEAAGELGARKAQAVLDAGAPLLISANPGCTLQIAAALADRGEHVAVAHTAEILDASLRALPPPVSAG